MPLSRLTRKRSRRSKINRPRQTGLSAGLRNEAEGPDRVALPAPKPHEPPNFKISPLTAAMARAAASELPPPARSRSLAGDTRLRPAGTPRPILRGSRRYSSVVDHRSDASRSSQRFDDGRDPSISQPRLDRRPGVIRFRRLEKTLPHAGEVAFIAGNARSISGAGVRPKLALVREHGLEAVAPDRERLGEEILAPCSDPIP